MCATLTYIGNESAVNFCQRKKKKVLSLLNSVFDCPLSSFVLFLEFWLCFWPNVHQLF